jgi:hypothetical protein
MGKYEETIANQKEARRKFGRMLYCWRVSNGWTQYTAHEWSKEAGFEIISYGNLSVLERGKAGELRQKAFLQLEELNRRVAVGDFSGVKTRALKDRLESSTPIVGDDKKLWDAVDFWACYIARLPIQNCFPYWEAIADSQWRLER